jgi:hypothetical protein
MREFLLTGIAPRGFVTDKDGFLDLQVEVTALSRRTGRKLHGKNLSLENLANCVSKAHDARLKSLDSPLRAEILAGQGSTFLFTSEEVENLGMVTQN